MRIVGQVFFLSGEGAGGNIGLIDGLKMIAAEKKALGGFCSSIRGTFSLLATSRIASG